MPAQQRRFAASPLDRSSVTDESQCCRTALLVLVRRGLAGLQANPVNSAAAEACLLKAEKLLAAADDASLELRVEHLARIPLSDIGVPARLLNSTGCQTIHDILMTDISALLGRDGIGEKSVIFLLQRVCWCLLQRRLAA